MNYKTMQKAMKQYMRTGIVNIQKIQQEERMERNKKYLTLRWDTCHDKVTCCVFLNTFNNNTYCITTIPDKYIERKGINIAKIKLERFEHMNKNKIIDLANRYKNHILMELIRTKIDKLFEIGE